MIQQLGMLNERSHHTKKGRGFALPTVLIASVVMLTVLAASVTATSSIRTNLKTQYYSQLAQAAGEAGVAYAKACLAANGNIPTWSDSSPLRPNTDCTGATVGGYPSSVTTNGDIVSSFSVGLPTVDGNGRAVTIPNNGYVQLLRSSTGAVWKTYTQPTTQAAVVPDLCSGSATSTLGWNNASVTTISPSISDSSALPITIATGNINPGSFYLRKDFSVVDAGTYDINLSVDDQADVYVDGQLLTSVVRVSGSGLGSASKVLAAGCHTILVRVINYNLLANPAALMLSVKKSESSNVVAKTDTSWRVSAGNTVHYSAPDYYQSSSWATVRDLNAATAYSASWTSGSGDAFARFISTNHSYSGANYPYSQYSYYRDSRSVVVTSPTEVKLTTLCDDLCDIYLDNNTSPLQTTVWSNVNSTTFTLTEGTHHIGVRLYNGGTAVNPSGFALSMVRTSDNVVMTRSDAAWLAANAWTAAATNYYSYDDSFTPNPSGMDPSPTAEVLIVGGGGGGAGRHGGGGGGGAVIYNTTTSVSVGNYPVVVGAGGVGTPSGSGADENLSSNGISSSVFSLSATGGGAGRGDTAGMSGGSGGGGGPGSAGGGAVTGQGNKGGTGLYSTYYMGGGGGGAGGGGEDAAYPSNTQPAGGPGVINSITGSAVTYAAGGRGGSYNQNTVATAGAANTGNGGGGAGGETNGGAAGGSGVVIISYPTGSITATGGTVTTSGSNTIHKFTSSGTFTVTSVN